MTTDDPPEERPLFAARYGVNIWGGAADSWQRRHRACRTHPANDDPPWFAWCRCPGHDPVHFAPCAQRITQEDRLCNECREYCIAVDDAGNRYLLADLAE